MKNKWQYEILYDQYNANYLMARVYYSDDGKPVAWEAAELRGKTLWQLSGKLEEFFKIYINSKKFKRITKTGRLLKSSYQVRNNEE